MRRTFHRGGVIASALFLGSTLLVAAGCNKSGGEGDPEMEKLSQNLNSAAKRAGGNYDKLSPDEKKQFLKMSSGDEGAAKNLPHALSGKDHEPWKGAPPPGALPEGAEPPAAK